MVDVVNSTVVEPPLLVGVTTVVSSVTVGDATVGVVVGSVVVSSEVVSGSDVTLPPVDSDTVCLLKRAIASSRGSATVCEARREDARRTETALKCLILV